MHLLLLGTVWCEDRKATPYTSQSTLLISVCSIHPPPFLDCCVQVQHCSEEGEEDDDGVNRRNCK